MRSEAVAGWLFVAPAVLLLVTLVAYPSVLAVWFSLSDAWIGQRGRFVGLDNFVRLLGNSIFRQTLQNSLVFTVTSVSLKIVLGLTVALLLRRITRLKRLIRGAILLPFIIPTALSTLAWWWIFDPSYSVINWTLKRVGVVTADVPWLSDPTLAMIAIIVVNTWRGLPFFAVTILAGLLAIPEEYYEAADLDGATAVRRFWHVTLPLVRPVLAITVLFSTILTLAEFNIVFVLTRGGPFNTTHLFSTLSFQIGLAGGKLSEGAAISLFLFPILLVIVVLQLRLVRRQSAYE